ncbi:MAG: glycosyltransferase family 39 protein [Polyangiaceae bacterium]
MRDGVDKDVSAKDEEGGDAPESADSAADTASGDAPESADSAADTASGDAPESADSAADTASGDAPESADSAADTASGDAPESADSAPDGASDEVSEKPSATKSETSAKKAKGKTSREADEEEAPRLTPAARKRLIQGIVIALVGAAAPFLLMTADRHFSFSVPVALFGLSIAAWGLFHALGTLQDDDEHVVGRANMKQLGSRVLEVAAAGSGFFLSLRLAVAGSLPWPRLTAAVAITATFLWLVVGAYRCAEALGAYQTDENGATRPLFQRHGFWLIAFTTLLYLPMLGSYSLSDPWETHYGEVAREMLARDDWISLWWAQDGWFWSKPVADFWMQSVFFSALGVGFEPDRMLHAVTLGRFPQPEWAARMPVFLLTLAGGYFLYKGTARVWGRRAALLGGLALVTMPYWFLIGHQTMTDMPYVAPLTAAMGLFMYGIFAKPEERVGVYELSLFGRSFRVSLFHLLFFVVILLALPQVLYLASRNLTLQLEASPHGFRPHLDEFFSGSGGGNCGLPGNEACRKVLPVNRDLQPWHLALIWTGLGGILLFINRAERSRKHLAYIAAWFFVALSALGKGAPGLVLPIAIAGAYIGATRRWKELTRVQITSLVLLVAVVTLPWYVQMYMRHGQPFTDRLLFHDMYKRAFVHVHDTNVGDDVSFRYYIWQLGYGLFPWTGIAAAALVWWARRKNDVSDLRGDGGTFMLLWFVMAFSMFTITLTKFHHYIFPVVPPTAVLVGVVLDRMIDGNALPQRRYFPHYVVALTIGIVFLVYGISRLLPGSILGTLVEGKPASAVPWIGYLSIGLGILFGGGGALLFGRPRAAEAIALSDPSARFDSAMFGAIGFASAGVVFLAGRDMYATQKGDIEGQSRLMHLFTYNYRRPWPSEAVDFDAALAAFTFVAVAACLLIAWRRFRTHASMLLVVMAMAWAAWGLDVYLVKCAPHWGQRETIMAYYRDRPGPEAPLVAYQMNWKGENFYTGNRTPAFVSSGQKFKDWVAAEKAKGVKTMYFTTEHGRAGSLKGELDNPSDFEIITSKELNNKFMIARVRF